MQIEYFSGTEPLRHSVADDFAASGVCRVFVALVEKSGRFFLIFFLSKQLLFILFLLVNEIN